MESIFTKLALYGSKKQCARTDNVFSPISEVCNGTVSFMKLCNSETLGHDMIYRDTGLQSYRVTKFQSFRVTESQSYTVKHLHSCRVTQLNMYRVTEFQSYKVTLFNGKLAPKFWVGAPKFEIWWRRSFGQVRLSLGQDIGHLIFRNFQTYVCRYF